MENKKTLVEAFASRFNVEADKLLPALKATAFKQSGDKSISNEQMLSLIVVANRHGLNPFTREIYAFPSNGGIVPIVGVDGWTRIMNENPNFNGIEFRFSDNLITIDGSKPCPEWVECAIHRKDREKPTVVREYLDEVYKHNAQPWKSHTKRMLRHKAMIQCARIAFSFGGIYDEEEGRDILINEEKVINPTHEESSPLQIEQKIKSKAEQILDNIQNKIKDKEKETIVIEKTPEELDAEFYADPIN